DDNNGVVTNMEGYFTLSLEKIASNKPLTISFMGYQTQQTTIKEMELTKYIVKLKEAVNQLGTVYINTKLPNVDSIMARVHRNLKKNYKVSNSKQARFSRGTTYAQATKLDVDIANATGFKKAQLEASNAELAAMADQVVNNPPADFVALVFVEVYRTDTVENKTTATQATR